MCRKLSLVAVATLFLALPTRLLAGGPPWLAVPMDGLNSDNTKATNELLTAKLKDKLYSPDVFRGVAILEHAKQPYATIFIKEDVGLRDIEAALKGSGVSVPRDRLHLFGHAILEIDPQSASPKELLADLAKLDYVTVADSENKDGRLLVSIDMPYPPEERRGESVAWEKFVRNDRSSDQATKNESPATREMLPSYNAIRDVVAKHKATLKDIRWDTEHACRTVGCVAVPDSKAVASTNRAK
jgi:hypothetical protein